MERFQGFMSQDSRRGSGLRIEFAKQRMGEVNYNEWMDGSMDQWMNEWING